MTPARSRAGSLMGCEAIGWLATIVPGLWAGRHAAVAA